MTDNTEYLLAFFEVVILYSIARRFLLDAQPVIHVSLISIDRCVSLLYHVATPTVVSLYPDDTGGADTGEPRTRARRVIQRMHMTMSLC